MNDLQWSKQFRVIIIKQLVDSTVSEFRNVDVILLAWMDMILLVDYVEYVGLHEKQLHWSKT